MKVYRLELRIKNNLLFKRITNKYGSVRSFCEQENFSMPTVLNLINLKIPPVCKKKKNGIPALGNLYWTVTAIRLSTFFDCSPFEMFPEETWERRKKNKYTIEADKKDFEALPFYEGITQALPCPHTESYEIINNSINKALETLTLREEKILKERFFDEKSLQEVAINFGLSPSRILQIENKALRKLRHKSRVKYLIPAMEELSVNA